MVNAFGEPMGWKDFIVFCFSAVIIFFAFGFRYHIVKLSMQGRKGKKKIATVRAARIREENKKILRGEPLE